MDEFEQLFEKVQKIGKSAKELSSQGMKNKTIIVHPQLSRTPDEAKTMEGDWKEREERQLLENFNRLIQ